MRIRIQSVCLSVCILLPWTVLWILSLGTGWDYPSLLPQQLNLAPWKNLFSQSSGLPSSLLTSALLSVAVSLLATISGILISRILQQTGSWLLSWLIFVPWVLSPVVVAGCFYDLLVRFDLAGSLTGVIYSQAIFATSFAAVLFRDAWTECVQRREALVRSLGGGTADVWRHVVLPQIRPLILVCLVQTALFSWLDYGFVSMIGGGRVQTVTLRLFALIREASVHQAALASLLLTLPSIMAVVFLFLKDGVAGFRGSSSGNLR
jgi:putative spermidine/putrescine transport system permease protein